MAASLANPPRDDSAPTRSSAVLTPRALRITSTGPGAAFALLLVCCLAASIVYNNNLGFILTFLLFSVGIVSIVHGARNLADLHIRCVSPAPVFAGGTATLAVRVDNPTPLERFDIRLAPAGATPQRLRIDPRGERRATFALRTERRGWHDAAPLTVSSDFPLGVVRLSATLALDGLRVLVYPAPAAARPEPTGAGSGGPSPGRGDDDFDGFLPYQPGDPLRRVHWKGVAKGQGVHTKQYIGREADAEPVFDWDDTHGASVEERLSLLCRDIIDADRLGLRYGLRLPGTVLTPDRGAGHRARCLEALALAAP